MKRQFWEAQTAHVIVNGWEQNSLSGLKFVEAPV